MLSHQHKTQVSTHLPCKCFTHFGSRHLTACFPYSLLGSFTLFYVPLYILALQMQMLQMHMDFSGIVSIFFPQIIMSIFMLILAAFIFLSLSSTLRETWPSIESFSVIINASYLTYQRSCLHTLLSPVILVDEESIFSKFRL